jgi:hypothetical protein
MINTRVTFAEQVSIALNAMDEDTMPEKDLQRTPHKSEKFIAFQLPLKLPRYLQVGCLMETNIKLYYLHHLLGERLCTIKCS